MNTKQKGDIAVANAIRYYVGLGYEVCLPLGDKRPYDLVVEKDGDLKRVQIKYTGFTGRSGLHKVPLRVMGGNRSWYSAYKYSKSDFDELFVYTSNDKKYVVPWSKITATNALTIEHKKYNIYEVI